MAVVLDSVIGKITEMLIDVVKDKVAMILDLPEEMEKLKRTLEMINCVLEDAERKRITSKVIEKWLQDLKDIVYEVDDIFDLWKIKIDQQPVAPSPAPATCLSLFSCCRKTVLSHDIGNKIKKLNLKLKEISEDKERYKLVNLPVDVVDQISSRDTCDLMDLDVVGTNIEKDTHELVELLTKQDTRANTLVLAITGIGGIGKTTLAQKIFHDDKIKNEFELKIWVCVSQDLNEIKLVRDIITGAGGNHGKEESRSILIPKLRNVVTGKRFLLVLDDVWDENLWENLLRTPLRDGAVGSRVIITTRKKSVSERMMAITTHDVELMSLEDSWSLLCKKVVWSGEEQEIEGLKEVGLKIVEKCGRLPLAIKTLGGVLCKMDRTNNAWESVLHNSAWSVDGLPEEVNKALYLSYLELPLELKRCFLLLSSFPEDHRFEMDHIVGMWIAEGLVKVQGEYSSLEEVGQSYFKELISRSLLQTLYESTCVIHDLLRFLAQFLTRDESLHIGEVNTSQLNNLAQHKVRHLSLSSSSSVEVTRINDFLKNKNSFLRTLMLFNVKHQLDGLFSHYPPCLRVLDLHDSIPDGHELPESLVGLVHLRYLDVSDTSITKLPNKLGNLRNLQFLLLHDCTSLDALPNSVVELPNLRRLNLEDSGVEGIPVGVERLENLRCLEGFVVQSNDDSGAPERSSLEDLQNLSHLTKLTLEGLERVLNCDVARAAAIGKKAQLKLLYLSCTRSWVVDEVTEEDMKRVEEVFEELQPPPSIETLRISYYPGLMPPSWMSLSAAPTVFSNLKTILLFSWKNCKRLPALGQLPNLTDLRIRRAFSVESIGSEFMGVSCNRTSAGAEREHTSSSSSVLFPKLKELSLSNMRSLKTWAWGQEVRALSSLQSLSIEFCHGLEAIPRGLRFHATSLTHLDLTNVDSLESITSLMKLKTLDVTYCASLSKISDFPSLETLNIENCPRLRVVKDLPALQSVTLRCYDGSIGSLPDWLAEGEDTAKPSRVLEIYDCTLDLMKKLEKGDEDQWVKMQHINHVKIYAAHHKDVYAIYTNNPYSFTTNINHDTTNANYQCHQQQQQQQQRRLN